jgi:hypothetical protein
MGLVRDGWRDALLVLSFPASYGLYFTTQRAMVVRNLLVLVPFVAILVGRGAGVLWDLLANVRASAVAGARLPKPWGRYALSGVLGACFTVNATWLAYAAQTILWRGSDRWVHAAAAYVSRHSSQRFVVSRDIRAQWAAIGLGVPANAIDDPGAADHMVFYAREGAARWQDWPANHPELFDAIFGPAEVNIGIYPNWWGDDHIVVMSVTAARDLHFAVATMPAPVVPPAPAPANLLTGLDSRGESIRDQVRRQRDQPWSWAIPQTDPAQLLSAADVGAIVGEGVQGPFAAGWIIDGTARACVAPGPLVITWGLSSAGAFEIQRGQPGSTDVPDVGADAFANYSAACRDLNLWVRTRDAALWVRVSGVLSQAALPDQRAARLAMARRIAQVALAHAEGGPEPPRAR